MKPRSVFSIAPALAGLLLLCGCLPTTKFKTTVRLLDEETGRPIPGALVIAVARVDYAPLREGPYDRALAAARGETGMDGLVKFGKLEGMWFGEEPQDKLWKLLESRKRKVRRKVLGVEYGNLLVFAPRYGFMNQPFGVRDNPVFQKEVQAAPRGFRGLYGWPLGPENREPVLLDSKALRKGTVVVLKMRKPDDPKEAYKDFRVLMMGCLIAGLTKHTGATAEDKERIYEFFMGQINEATGLFDDPFFVRQYCEFKKPELKNEVINWRPKEEDEDSAVQAWLAQKALEILPEECREVKEYSRSILEGLKAEGESVRTRNHFYDPNDQGKAFPNGQTALQWGAIGYPDNPGNEWDWADAQRYYRDGDRTKAYEALGHVLRLLDNLAIPKYTQTDREKVSGFEDAIKAMLEKNAGNLPPEYWMEAREPSAAKMLKDRFEDVARKTAELSAEKLEARLPGQAIVNGITGGAWEAMARKGFSGAIGHGAGVLQDFHRLMHRAAFVQAPGDGGNGKDKPMYEVKESTQPALEIGLPKSWMPKWKVGDWWVVQMTANLRFSIGREEWREPFRIRYEVVGIDKVYISHKFQEIAGIKEYKRTYDCFVVKAVGGSRLIYTTFLYYDTEKLVLRKARFEVSGWKPSKPDVEIHNEYSDGPSFSHAQVIPFDAPVFPLEAQRGSVVRKTFKKKISPVRDAPKAPTFIQEVSIVDDCIAQISRRFPTVERTRTRGDQIVHQAVDLHDEPLPRSKAILSIADGCYNIVIRHTRVRQFWNQAAPWAVYSENGYGKVFLEDHSWLH